MHYRYLGKSTPYRGFFRMEKHKVEHERFDGSSVVIERELMERGDAVALLLYDPAHDEVLLLEQFRIGPAARGDHPWLIEIVAGMVDAGESIEACAVREAIEEAGYAPHNLRHLGRYYTTPGGCSERIDLFYGECERDHPLSSGGGVAHEHEDIRRFWVKREVALEWVRQGRIASGAPMLALLLAFGGK